MKITITDVQESAIFEAGAVLSELACKVSIAAINSKRPEERPGVAAVRSAVRGDFLLRLAAAMRAEEQSVIQIGEAIPRLHGAGLLALGEQLGVEREPAETDAGYRVLLHAANDLETRPLRAQVREAGDALISTLLAPGGIADLLQVSIEALEG